MKRLRQICYIVTPIGKAGIPGVKGNMRIIQKISNELIIVIGNTFDHEIKNVVNVNIRAFGLLNSVIMDLKYAYKIRPTLKKCDTYFFGLGGETLFFTLLLIKLYKKNNIVIVVGNPFDSIYFKKISLEYIIRKMKSVLMMRLFSHIVVFSSLNISDRKINQYKNKIGILPYTFVDTAKFQIITNYSNRDFRIGYVGRLSEEKGIINLMKTIKMFKDINHEAIFDICGTGPLEQYVKEYINKYNLTNVNYHGWVDHKKLPEIYNSFKLLVIPSYSEGLPTVIIEALACGVPILCTKIGAMGDIIKDNYNGFTINSNNSEKLFEKIVEITESDDMLRVSNKSIEYIMDNYSEKSVFNKWNQFYKTRILKAS